MTLSSKNQQFDVRRNFVDARTRVRPKSGQQEMIKSIKNFGKPTLLKFEASKPGIEWIAQNWRRHRISNISESPYLTLLLMFAEDF